MQCIPIQYILQFVAKYVASFIYQNQSPRYPIKQAYLRAKHLIYNLTCYIQKQSLTYSLLNTQEFPITYNQLLPSLRYFSSMQQNQREQLEFIENFANMISSTFTKFANLCRQQINATKNNPTQASSVKPTIQIPKATPTVSKVPEAPKNMSQNAQVGGSKPQIRKPHNALSLFISDEREKILRQNPTLDFMQVTQRASAKWKNMSDEEKKPYLQRYEILKNNYQKQKDNFDPDQEAEKQQSKKTIKQNKIVQKNELAQKHVQVLTQQKLNENPESNSHVSSQNAQEKKSFQNLNVTKQINTLQDFLNSEVNAGAKENHKKDTNYIGSIVENSQVDEQSKKVVSSTTVPNNHQSFEQLKIKQKDDYEQIEFSQDDKLKPVEVIQIPQTQNEA